MKLSLLLLFVGEARRATFLEFVGYRRNRQIEFVGYRQNRQIEFVGYRRNRQIIAKIKKAL